MIRAPHRVYEHAESHWAQRVLALPKAPPSRTWLAVFLYAEIAFEVSRFFYLEFELPTKCPPWSCPSGALKQLGHSVFRLPALDEGGSDGQMPHASKMLG